MRNQHAKRGVSKVTTESKDGHRKKPRLENKSYPKHIWWNVFDQSDRDKVIQMRRDSKTKAFAAASGDESNDPDDLDSRITAAAARLVAQIQAERQATPPLLPPGQPLLVTSGDSEDAGDENAARTGKGGKAGNQFGMAAHGHGPRHS